METEEEGYVNLLYLNDVSLYTFFISNRNNNEVIHVVGREEDPLLSFSSHPRAMSWIDDNGRQGRTRPTTITLTTHPKEGESPISSSTIPTTIIDATNGRGDHDGGGDGVTSSSRVCSMPFTT